MNAFYRYLLVFLISNSDVRLSLNAPTGRVFKPVPVSQLHHAKFSDKSWFLNTGQVSVNRVHYMK